MLAEVLRHLRCPLCRGCLRPAPGALRCTAGHGFDVARHGYVSLLTGRAPAGADTAGMVTARCDLFGAGHFDPVLAEVAEAAADGSDGAEAGGSEGAGDGGEAGLVVDAGAGPGHYLAAALGRLPGRPGLALDVSKAAARAATRIAAPAGVAVCDIWRGLPLADGVADVVLDVFAPRNAAEYARVLRPEGRLIVATPRPEHLGEIVAELGLITVDPDKEQRLAATFADRFRLGEHRVCRYQRMLTPVEVGWVVAMGPSAWHADPARLARIEAPVRVTIAVDIRTYRPAGG